MKRLIIALLLLGGCADRHATPRDAPIRDSAAAPSPTVVAAPSTPAALDTMPHDQLSIEQTAADDSIEKANTRKPVLRPIAVISQLPRLLRDTMTARGCYVPQWEQGDTTDNVLRGDFLGEGKNSWAIWCVDQGGGSSRIVIFRDGSAKPRDEFQGEGTGAGVRLHAYDPKQPSSMRYGCVGEIGKSAAGTEWANDAIVHDTPLSEDEKKFPLHDAIMDAECEGVSNFHYFTGKRWVILPGGD